MTCEALWNYSRQQDTFSPSKVSELKPTSSDLSSLSAFPRFDSEAIEGKMIISVDNLYNKVEE